MNRLTKRHNTGVSWNGNPDHSTQVRYRELLDRLAAYEDTGLTSGDIRDLQGICAKNGLAEYVDTIVKAKRLIAKDNERSMEQDERIEQLEAELDEYRHKIADGRLVVLPCKVGDTVYFLIPELEMGEGGFNLSGLFISEPHRITEVGTRGFWTSGLPRDEPDGMHDFTPWGDLGKTVFLTREEAEAALRKEQSDER